MSKCRGLGLASVAILACSSPVAAQIRPTEPAVSRLEQSLRELAAGRIDARSLSDDPRIGRGEKIAVTIRVNGDVQTVAAALPRLQADIANVAENVVEAYVPVAMLGALDGVDNIVSVRQIRSYELKTTSQGSTVHNAASWNAIGFTGTGVKVGIIDSFSGYSGLIGTELPAPAAARCYTGVGTFSSTLANCGSSSHGTAVAETIVDIAPGASLYVANPVSVLDFRNTVTWMADNGVRVINFSAVWSWDGPGDGTSPFTSDSPLSTVDLAVSRGITFVMAAGNEQRATWTGGFSDQNADSWMEFSGSDDLNSVYLYAGERLSVQMRWDDSWTNAARDLDLGVYDNNFTLMTYSANPQLGAVGQIPREFATFVAPATGWFHIAVRRDAGAIPGWVQVQAFTGQTLYYSRAGWSIGNPGDSRNAGMLAVGAAHWNSPNDLAPYSSLGPTLDGRTKPDIVGVDGADTVTYGPGAFYGTSQASPHVAGLAALVLQAYPAFTPAEVTEYLKSRALPRTGANAWGAGLAYLPPLCDFSVSPLSMRLPIGAGTGSLSVTVAGPCAWSASAAASWINITDGTSRTGSGTLHFSVSDNSAGHGRFATVSVAGQQVTISQIGIILHPSKHDLNGDGTLDLFWQHETEGWVAAWLMDGTHLVESRLTWPDRVSDTNWKIVGTGDFNGDGRPDLFWQHQRTRLMTLWYMDGTTFIGPGLLTQNTVSDTDWEIRAIADLNGDSKPDLIWQHRTMGYVATWLMNGPQLVEAKLLEPQRVTDLDWKIVGAADFNGDGKNDLFWRNQRTGLMTVWFMNGTSLDAPGLVSDNTVSDLNWEIRAIGDINDDGKPDLIWQHRRDGWLNAWLMNGVTLMEGVGLEPRQLSDHNWLIAGPR